MKVVILAGGLGTRLGEETAARPKPMVEIGGRPIIWHIMKHYSSHGFNEFVIATGYRGDVLKKYFVDYYSLSGDVTVDLRRGSLEMRRGACEDWLVDLVDTGLETLTGGRLKRLRNVLGREPFMLTYGDGVANVDVQELVSFHRGCGRLVTVTAVRPPSRFGGLDLEGDAVRTFMEKPQIGEGWINGGFMVMEPEVLDHPLGDNDSLEVGLLERLAEKGQLSAYRHPDFWQCMDTPRDRQLLERLWEEGKAPWKSW
jgi:glucose-1-phosphate cytidylyltransferase